MTVIKEAVFQTCDHCGSRKRVSDDVRGCEVCKRVFDEKDGPPLQASVFSNSTGSRDIDFCSWRCAIQGLSAVECDYFVSLPYLHYDADAREGARAQDFFVAIKEFAGPSTDKTE